MNFVIFYISHTKSSLDGIFYKVVYHHIIYMCDFSVNLNDFFAVICMGFNEKCDFHLIRSLHIYIFYDDVGGLVGRRASGLSYLEICPTLCFASKCTLSSDMPLSATLQRIPLPHLSAPAALQQGARGGAAPPPMTHPRRRRPGQAGQQGLSLASPIPTPPSCSVPAGPG